MVTDSNASFTKTSHGIGMTVGLGGTSLNARYDNTGDGHMNATHMHATDAVYAAAKTAAADKLANSAEGMYEDSTSYGIGIDHTIGSLTFGIGYSATKLDKASKRDRFLRKVWLSQIAVGRRGYRSSHS